ncbi:conserved domain protein [Bacteroides clarus YIT 12056]|uniref:Conserved domain protein n=1 Tax=Bacteroides clarus YIT 12056 TaxID=762984 RepID=A0ABN0CP72_9BACE|nr:conserved domain protein [Bacteroides clarus YIT 12056]
MNFNPHSTIRYEVKNPFPLYMRKEILHFVSNDRMRYQPEFYSFFPIFAAGLLNISLL